MSQELVTGPALGLAVEDGSIWSPWRWNFAP